MEIIETIKTGLEDLPKRVIYYFGPKLVPCSEKQLIKHKNYKFELDKYDIKENGKKYVKMFDSADKQVLENMTIILEYNWCPYSIEFSNEYDPISRCYFQYKTKNDFRLEAVLDKLVLIAEKKSMCSKFYPPFQYVYAYIIFLFFSIEEDDIKASEVSGKYNTLKKMKNYISRYLTDDLGVTYYSKDTIYYKVFDRFVNKQLDRLKNKTINYNL
jgi:hypothetical protein